MDKDTKDVQTLTPKIEKVEFIGSFPMDIPDNRGKIYAVVCFTTEDYAISKEEPRYHVKEAGTPLPEGLTILEEGTHMGRHRTWGWYSKREDAERAIANNATDMCELGYYSHALVEEVLEGICADTEVVSWWRFVGEQKPEDKFPIFRGETIPAPEWAAHTCGFSMG